MDRGGDDESGSDESSAASWDDPGQHHDEADIFERDLERVRNNDPSVKTLIYDGADFPTFQNMTNEGWEDLGRDISNNTYLELLAVTDGALDNDENISSFFRGLSRSSSIVELHLYGNGFSAAGLMSLESFIHNSINLRELALSNNNIQTEGFNSLLQILRDSPIERLFCSNCGITSIEIVSMPTNLQDLFLNGNNIQSEGFNRLLRSLRDSSVEILRCENCGIESIEIDTDSLPKNLTTLYLNSNRINTNGCRGIATLLQKTNTLQTLFLRYNSIGDEGVATLVDALKRNTTLKYLYLEDNDDISRNGHILVLKMLNDISSINATLQSNHTLRTAPFDEIGDDISFSIFKATTCNGRYTVAAASREKVIQTQLHSQRRAKLVAIQGVQSQSVYGEIKPLHLPEVLSFVSRKHGQEELYLALKASIAEVMTTVDRKQCIQQCIAYHASIIAKYSARQKELNEQLVNLEEDSSELWDQRSNKRRRK